jgi:excisionase family DNA binding protein
MQRFHVVSGYVDQVGVGQTEPPGATALHGIARFEDRLNAVFAGFEAHGIEARLATVTAPIPTPQGVYLVAIVDATRPKQVQPTAPGPSAYTAEETARLLRVSANHVRRRVGDGTIAAVRLGKSISVPATEVARMLGCTVDDIPALPAGGVPRKP